MPRTLRNILTSPHLLLMLTMLFWAGNWIVSRGLREQVTPLGLNFWRWCVALLILLPFTWRQVWRHRRVVARRWLLFLALGGLSISLFNFMVYMAVRTTTAVNGMLIGTLQPVAMILLAWLIAGDRITRRQVVGAALSLAGMLVIVTRGDPGALLAIRFTQGDLWVLASLPVWGVYSVLLRHRPPEMGGMAVLTVVVLFGVVLLLPFLAYAYATGPVLSLNPSNVAAVLYLAVFASLLGLLFYNTGVGALGPNVSGLYIYLIPVFGAGLSWGVLGEAPHLYHLAGAALIFSGIALATWLNAIMGSLQRGPPTP